MLDLAPFTRRKGASDNRTRHALIASGAPLVVALVAQAALVIAVVLLAGASDGRLREQQRETVANQASEILRIETTGIIDLGLWSDLADAVADPEKPDTAFLAGRLTNSMVVYNKSELFAVIGPDDRPRWAGREAGAVDPALLDFLCPPCMATAAEVRKKEADPASGFETVDLGSSVLFERPMPADSFPASVHYRMVGDRLKIIVAAPIAAERPAERAPAPRPILVSMMDFDATYGTSMAAEIGVPGIGLAKIGSSADAVPIVDRSGAAPLMELAWPEATPAMDLVKSFAPVGVLFALLFTGLVLALVRWLRRVLIDQMAGEVLGNHLALHDPLTGLGNRAYLATTLDSALARVVEGTDRVALILIDLDGFKGVNDTHGHAVGDELIRQFADRLVRSVPAGSRTVRLGGDEFAVILEGQAAASAESVCADILALARRPFFIDGIEARVGASLGLARAPDHATDRSELLRRADVALYKAKGDGRNRTQAFEAALDQGVRQRRSLEEALRASIADPERLAIEFMPIHQLGQQVPPVVGIEAVLRWRHTRGGLVSANELVRAADEVGLSAELGTFMLRKACMEARAHPDLLLTVNVSPAEVMDPTFHDRVMMILDETDFPCRQLELELTDGLQHAGSKLAIQQLKRLRAAGIRLSLDNFGAGYANLAQLRALPIHRFKISPTLLRGLEGTEDARHIVNCLVALGRSIGLSVSAEGVESLYQLAFLSEAGCQLAQGRVFEPARPEEDAGPLRLSA